MRIPEKIPVNHLKYQFIFDHEVRLSGTVFIPCHLDLIEGFQVGEIYFETANLKAFT
jgi:hypothetical protein